MQRREPQEELVLRHTESSGLLPAEPRPGAMGSAASKRGKGPNSKTAGPPPSSIEFDEEHESALRALTVMVMGHTAVGKTAFVARVAKNQFSAEHDSDAQVSVSHMTQEVKGGEIVTVALWDVPGVQHYEPHTQTSDGASASIVVVDLTNPASFETAKHWHADMASNSSHHTLPTAADKRRKSVAKFQISSEFLSWMDQQPPQRLHEKPVYLVGNKADLLNEEDLQARKRELEEMATSGNFAAWYVVSARDHLMQTASAALKEIVHHLAGYKPRVAKRSWIDTPAQGATPGAAADSELV